MPLSFIQMAACCLASIFVFLSITNANIHDLQQQQFIPSAADVISPASFLRNFQEGGGSPQPMSGTPISMAKRRLMDIFSFLNKRRDSEFMAIPTMGVHTRSLEHSNCYFSPIQCYLEERKRKRSVQAAEAPERPMEMEIIV